MNVRVIGAGLAGCEAAWQIAKRGIPVELYEMKPLKKTPAHSTELFAELVCSNSFKAARVNSAAGLLKEEMRRMGSLLMECADAFSVPAGGALAVDRTLFAQAVTEKIKSNEKITVIPEEIVTYESIDMSSAFKASRYGKGDGDDYINCPMNKEEYELFHSELVKAERTPLHGVDTADPKVYEGCMPIEIMAQRGADTIRFGPMKPVGLTDPNTGHRPWAVLQLRKENKDGTMYNLVGFQTNLRFGEQKRVFGLIPALKNAEFVRYGVMHRNTFINSPEILTNTYSVRNEPDLFFAGQITGVEGYMESGSSGLLAGINCAKAVLGEEPFVLPDYTMTGALAGYISDVNIKNFQPMGANIGILPSLDVNIRDKQLKAQAMADRSLAFFERNFEE